MNGTSAVGHHDHTTLPKASEKRLTWSAKALGVLLQFHWLHFCAASCQRPAHTVVSPPPHTSAVSLAAVPVSQAWIAHAPLTLWRLHPLAFLQPQSSLTGGDQGAPHCGGRRCFGGGGAAAGRPTRPGGYSRQPPAAVAPAAVGRRAGSAAGRAAAGGACACVCISRRRSAGVAGRGPAGHAWHGAQVGLAWGDLSLGSGLSCTVLRPNGLLPYDQG